MAACKLAKKAIASRSITYKVLEAYIILATIQSSLILLYHVIIGASL